jgi:nucleoid DNA-binding protein
LKVKSTTKRTFDSHKNIDRRFLWWTVAKKLKGKVDRQKSLNIISFLLDLMLEELKVGTKISVGNFCKIFLKQLKPRKHISVDKKEYVISDGMKSLRFQLDKKLSDYLVKNLDTEETFKNLSEISHEQEIFGKDQEATRNRKE